ncbi:hypothetical protein ABZ892_14620 [Streptomyces sp. NPDC046924]|uniref:hypothetical protein n=1 Tax=Streptomyces sp. NPDC046924 TaxID=3155136 RepID=UPI0033D279E3
MTTTVVRDQLEIGLFANLFDEELEGPPPPPAPAQTDSLAHVWIVVAELKVKDRIAKQADFRGSFTAAPETRVDARNTPPPAQGPRLHERDSVERGRTPPACAGTTLRDLGRQEGFAVS